MMRGISYAGSTDPGNPTEWKYTSGLWGLQVDQVAGIDPGNRLARRRLLQVHHRGLPALLNEQAGVNLLLLQCSPQYEEMERFAEEVMPLVTEAREGIAA